ncbi:ATP-binding protein [Metallumcola ferriviriculae]|uniref:histidine kinase n=1 Tax=Metallumcola ferriviriculae TaxID=3039180 RepID=A0AAU0UTG5_9FIRM|nr:ATP-binding protein [Desulfitibacteraceae bacterium MK1]
MIWKFFGLIAGKNLTIGKLKVYGQESRQGRAATLGRTDEVDIRLKIFLILLFIGIVPSLLFGYMLYAHSSRLILSQQKEKLLFIAHAAADNVEQKMEATDVLAVLERRSERQAKIKLLNNTLIEVGKRFSDPNSDHGLSIYWLELGALVVNCPEAVAGQWVGAPIISSDSPAKQAMETGQPVFKIIDIRRGTYAIYSYPIRIDNEVAGVVNAMQSIEFLENGYLQYLRSYLVLILAISLLLALGSGVYLIFSLDRFSGQILSAIRQLNHNPGVVIPKAGGKIGEILKELQKLAINLANNRSLTQVALETVDTGVITTDREGLITSCNKEAEKIFRAHRQQLIGSDYRDFFRNVISVDESRSLLLTTLQTGTEFTDIEINIPRDEESKNYLCNTRMLVNWNGRNIGVLCTLKDINARKKLAELEGNTDMGNMMREVAAGLAHEIKNPLTTVRGFLQMAAVDGEQLPEAHYNLLVKELDRTLELVNQFRDLNRSESLTYYELRADYLVNEMVSLLTGEAKSKNVSISTDLAEVTVCWDEKKVKQILLNLMRNAFEAMPDGGDLSLKLQGSTTKGSVKIEVADNGTGMDSETLETIGRPFFTTKEGGTGLGLTLTKNLINQMNGYMEVTSRPGLGTVFTVVLPERLGG